MSVIPVAVELYEVVACAQCLPLHRQIIQRLFQLKGSEQARKTHFFGGRYENIYLARDSLPGLDTILDAALTHAAVLLGCDASQLQLGFWFNLMQQGDVTLAHSHDDDDELLSGTYYLQAPPQSGKLLLHLPHGVRTIDPVTGNFVFFHPRIEHEVTRHAHATPRISLGLNFGPKRKPANID
jgi:hypothetical protein